MRLRPPSACIRTGTTCTFSRGAVGCDRRVDLVGELARRPVLHRQVWLCDMPGPARGSGGLPGMFPCNPRFGLCPCTARCRLFRRRCRRRCRRTLPGVRLRPARNLAAHRGPSPLIQQGSRNANDHQDQADPDDGGRLRIAPHARGSEYGVDRLVNNGRQRFAVHHHHHAVKYDQAGQHDACPDQNERNPGPEPPSAHALPAL